MPEFDGIVGRIAPTGKAPADVRHELDEEAYEEEYARAQREAKLRVNRDLLTPTPRERAEACVRSALSSLERRALFSLETPGPYSWHACIRGACQSLREALEVLRAPHVVDGVSALRDVLDEISMAVYKAEDLLDTPVRSSPVTREDFEPQVDASHQAKRDAVAAALKPMHFDIGSLDRIIAAAETGI